MDYSNMKAQKVAKKKLDTDISISRSNTRKVSRSAKKFGISLTLVIIFFIIGLVGGFAFSKFAFTSDTFEMVTYAEGNADVYIGGEEDLKSYTELGVNCVAFGKDISDECSVTYYYRDDLTEEAVEVSKVDENVSGIYYAVYKCNNIKFKSVTLIRNIIVLKEEDNG